MTREIREVAVIGAGGVAGLASVFELLHTADDGTSTVASGEIASNPHFTKIVGFEQKDNVGGTWYTDNFARDPGLPSQEVLDTQRYDDVRVIKSQHKHVPSPEDLASSSVGSPVTTEVDDTYQTWSRSAVWPRLYTNVAEPYLRYSTSKTFDYPPQGLAPLITHKQFWNRLNAFSETNELRSRIRFNTEVYRVRKDEAAQKWIVTARYHDPATNTDKWYEESFDGVILAQGSFSIPYIPVIKGLSEYARRYPGSILHAKAYREATEFKDKRVVIVGANISAVDLGQYLNQVAKEVIISRNLSRDPFLPFVKRCISTFKNVNLITEYLPDTKQLKLSDGTILDDVDNVIICTGYHIEIPFLDKGVFEYSLPIKSGPPTSNSRIKGLYQHCFNVSDPSLTFVGKLVVQTLCRNVESQAAAVAGVWSGAAELPSKEEMYAWEAGRLEKAEEYLFHKYDISTLRSDFYDPMRKLYTKGRPDPIGDGVLESLDVYDLSVETFERLFNGFRTGKLDLHKDFDKELAEDQL